MSQTGLSLEEFSFYQSLNSVKFLTLPFYQNYENYSYRIIHELYELQKASIFWQKQQQILAKKFDLPNSLIQFKMIIEVKDEHISACLGRWFPKQLHLAHLYSSHKRGFHLTRVFNFLTNQTAFWFLKEPSPPFLSKIDCPSYLMTRFPVTPGLINSVLALGKTVFITSDAYLASGNPPHAPQYSRTNFTALSFLGIVLTSSGTEG